MACWKTKTAKKSAKSTATKTAAKKAASGKPPQNTTRKAHQKTGPKPPPQAATPVDEQLARYRSMRDFHNTAEPAAAAKREVQKSPTGTPPLCIQKHAATRLHYDFRLGWNGVLKRGRSPRGRATS